MNITIVSVQVENVSNNGKTYRKIAVAYRDMQGGLKEKKLTDFSVKQGGVDLLINAATGTVLEITIVKNGEYANWEKIALAGSAPAAAPQQASASVYPAAKPAVSNYETREERAARQLMIVRQSSISSAVSLMKTEKIVPSVQQILDVATAFENFVMGTGTPVANKESFEDFESDVPD